MCMPYCSWVSIYVHKPVQIFTMRASWIDFVLAKTEIVDETSGLVRVEASNFVDKGGSGTAFGTPHSLSSGHPELFRGDVERRVYWAVYLNF